MTPRRRTLWIALFVLVASLSASFFMFPSPATSQQQKTDATGLDPQRAFGYLVKICRIGTRVSGSKGMDDQQTLIVEHFTALKATVEYQQFDVPHPINGKPVRMNNLIVSWNPKAKERVFIACHYDTRPFPDQDRTDPRGTFLGANDGASGVALLMELGHHMAKLKPTYGVDFVLFDGEELVFQERGEEHRGKFFLGSEHFAKQYRDEPPEHTYVCGILVDMIGDKNLRLGQEKNSLKFAPDLVDSVWGIGRQLGIKEFIPRPEYEVLDDHIPLNEIAKIPTIDIIDFDYPHWHTTQDIPQNCSGQSLVKVGRVLLHWMEHVAPPKGK